MSLDSPSTNAVLSVRDLSVSFATRQGVVQAVDGLSFDVGVKEVLGIVGESGSGKSVAMYSMLGLVREWYCPGAAPGRAYARCPTSCR